MNSVNNKKPFLIVGIVLIVISIRFIISNNMSANNYDYLLRFVEVEAVCTKVEPIKGGQVNSISGYDVYVTYDIDGKIYEDVPIEHYELTIAKGDKVNVRVSKDLPSMCLINYPYAYYNYYNVLSYVILLVGVVFVVIYFVSCRKSI